jgi:hypothetical protein
VIFDVTERGRYVVVEQIDFLVGVGDSKVVNGLVVALAGCAEDDVGLVCEGNEVVVGARSHIVHEGGVEEESILFPRF